MFWSDVLSPSFVDLFIKHKQSRFSIILTDFNLKSSVMLAPNKKVSLSFEALKPVTDFSSLAMKVLDGIFFQSIHPSILHMLNSCLTLVIPWIIAH